jgi:ubiquitin C-terminal hydrolase
MIEEEYNPTSNEVMRHSSLENFETDDEEKVISLENCLKKFHDVEKLTDSTYCSKCKEHVSHQKSFEMFRPPPILTIQLKRFKRIGN